MWRLGGSFCCVKTRMLYSHNVQKMLLSQEVANDLELPGGYSFWLEKKRSRSNFTKIEKQNKTNKQTNKHKKWQCAAHPVKWTQTNRLPLFLPYLATLHQSYECSCFAIQFWKRNIIYTCYQGWNVKISKRYICIKRFMKIYYETKVLQMAVLQYKNVI